MKCKSCNGVGKVKETFTENAVPSDLAGNYILVKCEPCKGTGEVES